MTDMTTPENFNRAMKLARGETVPVELTELEALRENADRLDAIAHRLTRGVLNVTGDESGDDVILYNIADQMRCTGPEGES